MRKSRYLIYGAMLLPLIAGCSRKKDADTMPVPEISVAEVVVDSVSLHKTYPGYLSADKKVDVVARVNGTLTSKNYTDGQIVKKGQLLFTIESTSYADAVRQAQAQLESARSELEYATSHCAAVHKAAEADAVSRMEVIQAESSVKTAQAAVDNARAALRTAQTTLGYCSVYAPVTGRITAPTVNVGNFVGGGVEALTLATIYDDSALYAVFNIEDAQQIKMLSAKDEALDLSHIPVNFEEQLSQPYTASLDYVAPDINTGTGTLEMKARILNPKGELRDGMYVTIDLPYGVNPKALLVKDASLSTDQLGKFLYLVNDSDKVVYTPVKVGELVNDSMRLVTDGLHPGDRYVTKALLKVRNGMKVKPMP